MGLRKAEGGAVPGTCERLCQEAVPEEARLRLLPSLLGGRVRIALSHTLLGESQVGVVGEEQALPGTGRVQRIAQQLGISARRIRVTLQAH